VPDHQPGQRGHAPNKTEALLGQRQQVHQLGGFLELQRTQRDPDAKRGDERQQARHHQHDAERRRRLAGGEPAQPPRVAVGRGK